MMPRKLTELTAAMILANMTAEFPQRSHWAKSPEPAKPTKDRSKIKAARKQKAKRK